MPVLKCKMCGGTLNVNDDSGIAVCEYCGTRQTLPKIDNERKLALYDRASHFRRNNEFDKASAIYEQVLGEDNKDAEAYWSLVLCRYGIEYVEDPQSHKRIPTVNRAQYTSIFNDEDYKKAIEYATVDQKVLYEEEAIAIDDIQKGILEVSSKEEPFDIFICYKETDNNGRRTLDSVLAQDIYKELTNEGYKVFFSRITLEDKLGSAYEPYIFAALNSAKVMIVVGTKPEYFNAVWVKNEWSRYLSLIKKGEKKTLIPAYRDMDPYDLPEEFAYLQAQDMSKLGFMQDLIRGVEKIIGAGKRAAKETLVINNQINSNVTPLLERMWIFLEDEDFKSADEYCDRILDIDPKNADAYLGKILVENQVSEINDLINYYKNLFNEEKYETKIAFDENEKHVNDIVNKYVIPDYLTEDTIKKLYQFDRSYQSLLQCRIDQKQQIISKLQEDRLVNRFLSYASAPFKGKFDEVYSVYDERIQQAKADDSTRIKIIKDNYDHFLNEADLSAEKMHTAALEKRENDYQSYIKELNNTASITQLEDLINKFKSLGSVKDSEVYIGLCNKKIDEIKESERIEKEITARKKKKQAAFIIKIAVVFVTITLLYIKVLVPMMKYNKALSLYESGDYVSAYTMLNELGNYKDASTYRIKAYQGYLKETINDYSVGDYLIYGTYEQDNNTSNGKEDIEWQILAKEENRIFLISRYALDCQQYNSENVNVTWETCSLRSWLNSTFYDDAFSDAEKTCIATSIVTADPNLRYSTTNQGNDTEDKIFLMSIKEVSKYLSSNVNMQSKATEYAYGIGAYRSDNGNCRWWLRTSGHNSSLTLVINSDGYCDYAGVNVDDRDGAVRPALWINLSND